MVEERELARKVYRIIGSLPKIQYRRFVLYYQTDTSFEKIAEKENCSSSPLEIVLIVQKGDLKNIFKNRPSKMPFFEETSEGVMISSYSFGTFCSKQLTQLNSTAQLLPSINTGRRI